MTRIVHHQLPTEDTASGRTARRLGRLLGPAVQAPDDSATAAELLGLAEGVEQARTVLDSVRDEAFVDTADELLTEWEIALGVALGVQTTADRRTALLAITRARRSGSPQDLLAAVQLYVPTATIRERTTADADALGSAREVFRLRVALGSSYGDAEIEGKVGALLRAALPAHATYDLGTYEYDELVTEASEELVTESSEVLTVEA